MTLSLVPLVGTSRLESLRQVLRTVGECVGSRVSVKLWDGSVVPLGPDSDPNLCVVLHGPGVVGSLLRRPTLDNLLNHYATGRIDFEGADLYTFAEAARTRGSRAKLKNLPKLWLARKMWPFLFSFAGGRDTPLRFAAEAGIGDRAEVRNNKDLVQFHYDVGNDFYGLFLGKEMHYTCNYFTDWSKTTDEAQVDKMEMICRKLRLKPGDRLLDAGCGWGGLICYAARHYGVTAHGMNLSKEQVEFIRAKVKRLGLEGRVTVEQADAYTMTGRYDKIASIGMFEHIGIDNYEAMLRKMYGVLRDRGIVLIHMITRGAKPAGVNFRKSRPEHRLFRKYVFPGGELGNVGDLVKAMEASRLEVHDVEGWRDHYAETLKRWSQALAAREDEAIRLVGAERYRLWMAYMVGMGLGFKDGTLRLFQAVGSKHAAKGPSAMPNTRADLYDRPLPSAA